MTSQQFCIRWNSHLGSIGAAFPQMLAGQRFVDVTLACEGHQVHCHRLVLAACSTYFEALLGENPCKHPIIILPRDIRLWEIQALVDFMYKGEVNVSQAGLPDLIKVAEMLQIRGLCGADAALNLDTMTTEEVSPKTNTDIMGELNHEDHPRLIEADTDSVDDTKNKSDFAMANVMCEYEQEPRHTRRIRRSENLLAQAADCVSRGQTFQTVSNMFHIPISTIR
ncbi:longitudinals lacking protein-like [Phlebotomus argentipes]|uniref:longitudinals lacking protein-like n=1 Tax=Phlebotomus argentipes TaxID=94469 RepID=UPI0028934E20|nr:longitudinals lacking protein-like [Phlebotomus argentipes]